MDGHQMSEATSIDDAKWNETKREISYLRKKHLLGKMSFKEKRERDWKSGISNKQKKRLKKLTQNKFFVNQNFLSKATKFKVTPIQASAALPFMGCHERDVDLHMLAILVGFLLSRQSHPEPSCHMQTTGNCCCRVWKLQAGLKTSQGVQTDLSCASKYVDDAFCFGPASSANFSSHQTEVQDLQSVADTQTETSSRSLTAALTKLTGVCQSLLPLMAIFKSLRNPVNHTNFSKDSSKKCLEATSTSGKEVIMNGIETMISHYGNNAQICSEDSSTSRKEVTMNGIENTISHHGNCAQICSENSSTSRKEVIKNAVESVVYHHETPQKCSQASSPAEDAITRNGICGVISSLENNVALIGEKLFEEAEDARPDSSVENVLPPEPGARKNIPLEALSHTLCANSDVPASISNERASKPSRKRKLTPKEIREDKALCLKDSLKRKFQKHLNQPSEEKSTVEEVTTLQNANDVLFEEINADELEKVLLVLRQQELLQHIKNGESVSSSSDQRLLFKKLGASQQSLPPGLQNCRVLGNISQKKSSFVEALEEGSNKFAGKKQDISPFKPKVAEIEKKKEAFQTVVSTEREMPVTEPEEASTSAEEEVEDCKYKTANPMRSAEESQSASLLLKAGELLEKAIIVAFPNEKAEDNPSYLEVKEQQKMPGISDELLSGLIEKPEDASSLALSEDMFEESMEKNEAVLAKTMNALVNPELNFQSSRGTSCENSGLIEEHKKILRRSRRKEEHEELKTKAELDDGHMPPPSQFTSLNSHASRRASETKQKEIQVLDISRAHDLAVFVLLNPWRGLLSRRTSKRFNPPLFDKKYVAAALWDLRSFAPHEQVTSQILNVGWEQVNNQAFEIMVSMFVEALSRSAPFVIEAAVCEDPGEDSCASSECSEIDTKKKYTPVRLVASKLLLKGEPIVGLNGLLRHVKPEEEKLFKKWNFLKCGEKRFAIYGPLAYLKRKEESNAKAFFVNEVQVGAIACQNINIGEKITINFSDIEKTMNKLYANKS